MQNAWDVVERAVSDREFLLLRHFEELTNSEEASADQAVSRCESLDGRQEVVQLALLAVFLPPGMDMVSA